jgi:hypothetical protein
MNAVRKNAHSILVIFRYNKFLHSEENSPRRGNILRGNAKQSHTDMVRLFLGSCGVIFDPSTDKLQRPPFSALYGRVTARLRFPVLRSKSVLSFYKTIRVMHFLVIWLLRATRNVAGNTHHPSEYTGQPLIKLPASSRWRISRKHLMRTHPFIPGETTAISYAREALFIYLK